MFGCYPRSQFAAPRLVDGEKKDIGIRFFLGVAEYKRNADVVPFSRSSIFGVHDVVGFVTGVQANDVMDAKVQPKIPHVLADYILWGILWENCHTLRGHATTTAIAAGNDVHRRLIVMFVYVS